MITWTLIIDGKVYSVPRREQADGAEFPPGPWAKCCSWCLRVWAQGFDLEASHRSPQATCFSVHSTPCAGCAEPHYLGPIPGSVLDDQSRQGFDHDLLEDLPYDLLLREFEVHLKVNSND